jgi:hypothetical protein
MESPIFIVGTQRSGTTLLCRMLTAHPNIFIKNEISDALATFSETSSKEKVLARINADLERAYGSQLDSFLQSAHKTRWGLKEPLLTHCLDSLVRNFPDAKLIIIIRDGRAVANSYIKSQWGVANIHSGAKRWKEEIGIQTAFAKAHPDKCLITKYEDIITTPEERMRTICEFLGETYTEKMIHYYNEPAYLKKRKQSENAFRELDATLMDKWRSELTVSQINVFESIAGTVLQQHGYDLVGEKISIGKPLEAFYTLHQAIVGEVQMQYRWRVKQILRSLFG